MHSCTARRILTLRIKECAKLSRPSASSRSVGRPYSQKVFESLSVCLYATAQCRPWDQHWHRLSCHSAPPPVSSATQTATEHSNSISVQSTILLQCNKICKNHCLKSYHVIYNIFHTLTDNSIVFHSFSQMLNKPQICHIIDVIFKQFLNLCCF